MASRSYEERPPMRAKVWVGRVKSNCPPEFLEAAFARIGKLIKVETGFAGFAFVDFEEEDDADEACKRLNKTTIINVGEVLVSRATQRGYEDACTKREIYQRTKGRIGEVYQCGDHRGSRGFVHRSRSRSRSRGSRSRSRSRSPSRRRQRARADSRSLSYQRTRNQMRRRSSSGRSRSKSKGGSEPGSQSPPPLRPKHASASPTRGQSAGRKSKDRSWSRRPSRSKSDTREPLPRPKITTNGSTSQPTEPSNSNAGKPPPPDTNLPDSNGRGRATESTETKLSESPRRSSQIIKREPTPLRPEPSPQDLSDQQIRPHQASTDPYHLALDTVHAEGTEGGAILSPADRAAVVQFFDGASTRELLLESAAVLTVPDMYVLDILNGFPHAFQGLSQIEVVNLLNVFKSFIGEGGRPTSELSAEVRQTIVVNPRGQRIMRKTILVGGNVCCSEEHVLPAQSGP